MSPTEKIGEELRRIFMSSDKGRSRTPQERYRDSVGAYAVGCLAAFIFFSLMRALPGMDDFPGNMPIIGWPLGLLSRFALPAYWLLLAWWVYLDAKLRGMNAAPWGLLCLASNFIGFFAYLVVRNPDPVMCGGCGRAVDPGVRVCPYCGAMTERVCPSCGAPIGADWQYCPACACLIPQRGGSAHAPSPVPPPAVSAAPISEEQRTRDIPRIIEQARSAASSAQEADARVSEAVERIVSGQVFSQRGRIAGCVFDAATGKPIPGAEIRSDASAARLSTNAGPDGMYSFVDLTPGPYVLMAEADGYFRVTRSCNAAAGHSTFLDFRMVPEREPASTNAP